ncbi:MAG: FHA domain-containing protein [Chromatiaceae bacterium]
MSATPEGRIAVQEADDVMLSFTSADSAFASACLFQQRWGQALADERQVRFRALLDAVPADPGSRLGPAATLEIAHQLPATRLFATHRFIHALPPFLRTKFRAVEPDATACGAASIQLFESCCAEEDCTQLAIPTLKQPDSPREHSLRLRWRSNQLQLDTAAPPITLGRGSAADIRIRTEYVSRTHAKVTFVQTNYVLYDESTNGTFVRIDDDEEKFIHQEQIVLRGSGVISLGRGIKTGTASLIYFTAT